MRSRSIWLASGVLVQVRFKSDLLTGAQFSLDVAGFLLSLAFYVLHERFGDFVHVARKRAKELEKNLGFTLYSSSPTARRLLVFPVVTAINAARFLFLMGAGTWLVALWRAVAAA